MKLILIASLFALISCTSNDMDSDIKIGKWSFYQDQNTYTEVWIDENYAVLIDRLEDVHIYSYTLNSDTLSMTEIGNPEQPSFMDKARHLSIVKNVMDGREDKWVSELEPILEKDIALKDTVFHIDTSLSYRQKVMKEFAKRYRPN